MPSFATHHIFATTVQRVTGDSVSHIAASYPAGYRWGAQGPEPLALYRLPVPSHLHRLAHRMRAEAPGALFEALCAAAVQERSTAALAYVFGFCTNYALDRVTHAFIRAQADRLALFMPGYSAEARRRLVESDIDGVMIADYIDAAPASFEAYRLLDPKAPECTVLARVLARTARTAYGVHLAPAAAYRSFHDMRRVLHLRTAAAMCAAAWKNSNTSQAKADWLPRSSVRPSRSPRTAPTRRTAPGWRMVSNARTRLPTCSMPRSRSRSRSSALCSSAIISESRSIRAFSPQILRAKWLKVKFLII